MFKYVKLLGLLLGTLIGILSEKTLFCDGTAHFFVSNGDGAMMGETVTFLITLVITPFTTSFYNGFFFLNVSFLKQVINSSFIQNAKAYTVKRD